MSTQVNTYVMYCIRLPYAKVAENHDKIAPYTDSAFDPPRPFKEVTCLFDGMDGKYVFLGYVFARTDDFEMFQSVVDLPRLPRNTKKAMGKALTALAHEIVGPEVAERLERAGKDGNLETPYGTAIWRVVSHYR